MSRLASTIEAILYLKAQPLSIAQISEFAGCDRKTTEEGLLELMGDYAHRDTALEVVDTGKGYTLQLRESYQNLVHALIPADVGVGALRTLAVIAMRGPLTQTDLVDLRGSGAYQHVQELVTQGFVKRRRKSDGRSYWVQVTDKFHQYFQLNQLPEGVSQLISRRKAKPAGEEVTDGEAIALDTSEEMRKDLGAEEPLELDELQLED
ncbi:MAG: SMC-Scp complex subunit ScpB [Myxacorys chilensis ATA2-1-KO14]|jgi:segregation and condensation protein B|nr:SMC-Scp complex subunit ScpB [Myxacorys chilensis ATA2-1-KO14]